MDGYLLLKIRLNYQKVVGIYIINPCKNDRINAVNVF